jgi:exodeoxyribonuclease VII large subunit
MVTPVLSELKAAVADLERRMLRTAGRSFEDRRNRLNAAARGLPRPADLLALASQRFDLASGRLGAALERNTAVHERDLVRSASRLTPGLLDRPRRLKAERLAELSKRMDAAALRARDHAERRARLPDLDARARRALDRRLTRDGERLGALGQLLASLNPDRPLKLGFARVHRADGTLVKTGASLASGEAVSLKFEDVTRGAVIDGEGTAPQPAKPAARPAPKPSKVDAGQGDLF